MDNEEELPALFRDDLPDKLSDDLLALAHLSDADEDAGEKETKKARDMDVSEEQVAGPVRRSRKKNPSNPYARKPKKTEEELFNDDMTELDFRTRAWKPFSTLNNAKNSKSADI
jgi:hypothetical protein